MKQLLRTKLSGKQNTKGSISCLSQQYAQKITLLFWCKTLAHKQVSDLYFDIKRKWKKINLWQQGREPLHHEAEKNISAFLSSRISQMAWEALRKQAQQTPLRIERVNKAYRKLDVKMQSFLSCNAQLLRVEFIYIYSMWLDHYFVLYDVFNYI